MIASLGMYDRAATAPAHDRFWVLIRDGLRQRGVDAPFHLNRETPFWESWTSPDLLFSQTCGRPYRLRLYGHVSLVGTPDYDLPGCPAGYYNSVFVIRSRDPRTELVDFREARFAFNEEMSQSGWAAPQTHVAGLGFQFGNTVETGGHLASAFAVADNRADIAALDAMTWELIKRHDGFSPALRVLERTEPTPGLPYISGPDQDVDAVRAATAEAIDALSLEDRRILRITGLVEIPPEAYLAVPNP